MTLHYLVPGLRWFVYTRTMLGIWLEISAWRAKQGLGVTARHVVAPNWLVHSPPPAARHHAVLIVPNQWINEPQRLLKGLGKITDLNGGTCMHEHTRLHYAGSMCLHMCVCVCLYPENRMVKITQPKWISGEYLLGERNRSTSVTFLQFQLDCISRCLSTCFCLLRRTHLTLFSFSWSFVGWTRTLSFDGHCLLMAIVLIRIMAGLTAWPCCMSSWQVRHLSSEGDKHGVPVIRHTKKVCKERDWSVFVLAEKFLYFFCWKRPFCNFHWKIELLRKISLENRISQSFQ